MDFRKLKERFYLLQVITEKGTISNSAVPMERQQDHAITSDTFLDVLSSSVDTQILFSYGDSLVRDNTAVPANVVIDRPMFMHFLVYEEDINTSNPRAMISKLAVLFNCDMLITWSTVYCPYSMFIMMKTASLTSTSKGTIFKEMTDRLNDPTLTNYNAKFPKDPTQTRNKLMYQMHKVYENSDTTRELLKLEERMRKPIVSEIIKPILNVLEIGHGYLDVTISETHRVVLVVKKAGGDSSTLKTPHCLCTSSFATNE